MVKTSSEGPASYLKEISVTGHTMTPTSSPCLGCPRWPGDASCLVVGAISAPRILFHLQSFFSEERECVLVLIATTRPRHASLEMIECEITTNTTATTTAGNASVASTPTGLYIPRIPSSAPDPCLCPCSLPPPSPALNECISQTSALKINHHSGLVLRL